MQKFLDLPENENDRKNYVQWFANQHGKGDPSKKTIAFCAPKDNGTAHFRIFEPLRAMYRLYGDKYNFVLYQDYAIPIDAKIDLVVFHVAHHRALFALADIRNNTNIKCVFDADDYFDVPRDHPSYTAWKTMGMKGVHEELLKGCNLATVTTNELKRRYSYYSKTEIIRNSFDFRLPSWNFNRDWLYERHKEGKLVIGWAGSPVHVKDLELMSKFLKVVHDKYPHTHFVIAGLPKEEIYEKYIEGEDGKISIESEKRTEDLEFHKKVKEWFSGFSPDRLSLFLRADISEYGKFYSMFDINIAYTRDDVFSRCKSEIKIIEGLAYGAIPLFSYMGGYKDYFDSLEEKEWAFAVQVDSKDAWVRKLSAIVEDFVKYKTLALELGKKARVDYSIDTVSKRRLEIYEELINN